MSLSISPRLSSGLCPERVPVRPFAVNGLMAFLANYQRLAAARRHPLDPERFFALAWLVQIRQLADVVNLAVPICPAQLALLRQKTLHHLAPNAEDLPGPVVEDGAFLPTQFDAPETGYQWLLLTAFDDDFQHLLGAVKRASMVFWYFRRIRRTDVRNLFASVLTSDRLHDPVELPQAMDVEGQQVVLHEAPIFRLVLRDDAEVRFLSPCGQVDGLASSRVSGAFLADDSRGRPSTPVRR